MRALGVLALLALLTTGCSEPDPYEGYSPDERRWLELVNVAPGTEEAEASLRWAAAACEMYEAGARTADIYRTLDTDGDPFEDQAEREIITDLNAAKRIFCDPKG